jgi:hypothetical protein
MMFAANLAFAAVVVAAAIYAQHRIGAHTASPRNAMLTRVVLAVVGIALACVAVLSAPPGVSAPMLFVQAFGVVHVPAAIILFFKRARGEEPS